MQRALLLLCLPVVLVLLLVLRAGGDDYVSTAPVPKDLSGTKLAKKFEKQIKKSSAVTPAMKKAEKRAERKLNRRQATPRARAERRRSLTAYKDLSAKQAQVAVADKQPKIIETPAWQAPELKPGEKVLGYADANTARIDMPGKGPDAFVTSTLEPLALPAADGKLKPITLELKKGSDGMRPERSGVPLLVPDNASSGISFGEKGSGEVRLSLGGSQAKAALVGDGKKAFYANTQTDTDTIVEALPLGAEISWTLRSPASPSSFPLNFESKASKFKLLADGSASFDAGPLGEGIISAPIAWDAQGRSVETKLVNSAGGVSVDVVHRDAEVAYPIVVDPAVVFGGVVGIRDDTGYNADGTPRPLTNGGGATPFTLYRSTPNMEYSSTVSGSGYRMKIAVNTATTGSQYARLVYDAPRTASVFRASFSEVSHVSPAYTTLLIGIVNSGLNWEGPVFGNTPGMPPQTVDVCAISSCGLGGSPDNKAMIHLQYNRTGGAPATSPYVQTRGAYIYFSDYTAPTLDFGEFQNMPATGWGQNLLNPRFRALVTDTGVGVGNANNVDTMGVQRNHASAFDSKIDGVSQIGGLGTGPPCVGGWAYQCPLVYERRGTVVPLQNGTHTYALTGADIVGNKTTHTYVFRTDREAPELDLSGRLGAFALDSAALGTGDPRTVVDDAPFVIKAFDGRRTLPDGSPASVKDHRSGVKQLSAKIYGSSIVNGVPQINEDDVKRDFDAESTPAGPKVSDAVACDPNRSGNNPDVNNSCQLSYGGTFNASTLEPGVYFFRVNAVDYAGNEVEKDFKVAVGVASMNTVVEGQASARYVPVQVKRERGSATSATIQFRTGVNKPWCNVDASSGTPGPLVAEDGPRTPVSNTVAIGSDGLSANYVLDLDALRALSATCTSPTVRLLDGKVYVRTVMAGTSAPSTRASEDVTIRYEHGGLGTEDATTTMGPGKVDLVTGNFSMSETDVNVDAYKSDLTVTRTYNSRYNTQPGPLGPGWKFGVESDTAGSTFVGVTDNADIGIPDEERYPTVEVESADGEFLTFELTATPDKYRAQNGAESLVLERLPDAADATRTAGFKIHDRDSGTVTSFRKMTSAPIPGTYELDQVFQPGASDEITYAYGTYPGIGSSVSYAFSPAAGVACRDANETAAEAFATLPRGCQALEFNYSDMPGVGNRLFSIDMKAWDPATSAMKETKVSEYTYDSPGRLKTQWDPRITPALVTRYDVLNEGTSRIYAVTPAGEATYAIDHKKLAEDDVPGRISGISRTPTGGTTATWTPRYYVPTQGAGAPFDFSATEVAKWGQEHPPYIAAGVFAPDQPPNGSPATNYDRASMTYMDPLGRTLNTREPGDRITTTEYDKWGATIRTLGAENRARALAEGTPAARLAAARKWDTQNEYAPVPGSLTSRRHLTRTIGPERQIRLEDGTWVQARTATDYTYDEGSPILGDNTKEPFDLVTTVKESALVEGTLRDTRKSRTDYGTTEDQWKLRIPLITTTDPDGLQIKQKVTVNSDGSVTERFQPRSQASDQPSTTKIVYYSAGENTATPECGGRPEWLGLPCKKGPGVQPTTAGLPGLPVQTITYNYLRQPLVSAESVVDAAGSTKTRSSTKTYDEAGRVVTEEVIGSVGTALSKVTHVYSTTTGREISTKTGSGPPSGKTITRVFDSLGRQTNYTDAEGHASSVTYDILSRPATVVNEKATRTNTYDLVTGDLVYASDSAAGDFVGVYDADARLVGAALPGGMTKVFTFDTTGTPTYTAYNRGNGCSTNCLLFDEFGVENAHGQFNGLWDNMTGQDSTAQFYDYDAAGRLTRVQDWRNDSGVNRCEERDYSHDADSNRTKKVVNAEIANDCDWSSTGIVQNNTFDSADRMTNSGYVYDAFGRITSAPGADTGGTSAFSASYYVNDLARSVTQDGTMQTLDLDPMLRMSVKTTTSAGPTTTESYAYTNDSDSPTFTQKGAAWNRTVMGIGGADAVQDSATGVKLLIQNLRGDVVAQSTTAGVLSNFSRVDEFGVPKSALPAGTKYAFHGSKQREALTSGGIVAMGVRLYQPQMGRFLQDDPVLGGSAGPYEYAYQDPVNISDLSGECPVCAYAAAVAIRAGIFAYRARRAAQLARAAAQRRAYKAQRIAYMAAANRRARLAYELAKRLSQGYSRSRGHH